MFGGLLRYVAWCCVGFIYEVNGETRSFFFWTAAGNQAGVFFSLRVKRLRVCFYAKRIRNESMSKWTHKLTSERASERTNERRASEWMNALEWTNQQICESTNERKNERKSERANDSNVFNINYDSNKAQVFFASQIPLLDGWLKSKPCGNCYGLPGIHWIY